jgi:hypothetical protein
MAEILVDYATVVGVPLWFPTLLLAALAAFAWRKQRSEGQRGFAVEKAKATTDCADCTD